MSRDRQAEGNWRSRLFMAIPSSWTSRISRLPGFGLLIHLLSHALLPAGTYKWHRITHGLGRGSWLLVDPRYEGGYIAGTYDEPLQAFLATNLYRGAVFFDIGAHIGFFAIGASRLVGTSGKVFAFEPDPENLSRFRRQIQRNLCENVSVIPVAVGVRSESVAFYRASDASSRNMGSIATQGTNKESEVIMMPSVSIDSFVGKNVPPNVVKIDVEGAEVAVVEGMKQTLVRYRPTLIVEVHASNLVSQLRRQFLAVGYEATWLADIEPGSFPAHLIANAQVK